MYICSQMGRFLCLSHADFDCYSIFSLQCFYYHIKTGLIKKFRFLCDCTQPVRPWGTLVIHWPSIFVFQCERLKHTFLSMSLHLCCFMSEDYYWFDNDILLYLYHNMVIIVITIITLTPLVIRDFTETIKHLFYCLSFNEKEITYKPILCEACSLSSSLLSLLQSLK